MVYNIRDYYVYGFCPSSAIVKKTALRGTVCFQNAVFLRIPDDGQRPKPSNSYSDITVSQRYATS